MTVALVAVSVPAGAEIDVWMPVGPAGGGEARVVLASPQQPGVVYAGMYGGGLFMSEDSGDRWHSMAEGLASAWIGALATAPNGTLYAATNRGVFRWQPETSTWRRISEGLPGEGRFFISLAVDPTNSDILFVMATDAISGSARLYRTRDGENWTEVTGYYFDYPMAIAPTHPPTLLAGTFNGLRLSRNGGVTWQTSTAGLPEVSTFNDILVDPAMPGWIYTSVQDFPHRGARPYKSLDGGYTWRLAGEGIPPGGSIHDYGRLAADPVRPGHLLWGDRRGVFRSTNSAGTWQPVNSAPADRRINDLTIAPDGSLFAAVDRDASGVLRSRDDGASWQSQTDGFSASLVTSLSPDPQLFGRWLASTAHGGLQVSDDNGDSWRAVTDGLPGGVDHVVRDRDTPSTLYVTAGHGLYRSIDSGDAWHRIGPEPPDFFFASLRPVVQDPSAAETLYVVSGDEIWRSLNGGDHWQLHGRVPCRLTFTLAPPAGDGSMLGGCVTYSSAPVSPPIYDSFLLRSVDGGVSWEEVLRTSEMANGIWSFAPGLSPGTLLASLSAGFTGGGGVFRSDDAGVTWTEIEGLRGIGVRAMLADPDRGELFAATTDRGILESADGDATWLPFNKGLGSGSVHALAFDPHLPGRLWAGTSAGAHRLDRVEVEVDVCGPSSTALCLLNRFRAEVTWEDFAGNTGVGTAESLTSTTGTFWFFEESNTELAVKVVDGRDVNGHFWVFYAGLSNVNYVLTLIDVLTGRQRVFENPLGLLASGGDIGAFPDPELGLEPATSIAASPATAKETPPLTLRDGRFLIEVLWRTPAGDSGSATGLPLSTDSGVLWFFEPANLELFIKILDGRPINGRFWLFFSALSNLGFDLTVTDLETGASRSYANPFGTFASQLDLELF